MSTRRTLRIAREIKEIVSRVIILELADPRLGFVTVTEVEVTPDLRTAQVKLSVLGDPADGKLCLKAIEHARGRIQSEVNASLMTKVVPRLTFVLDDRVKKSIEISRLINKARAEYREPSEAAPQEATEEEAEDAPKEPDELYDEDEEQSEDEDEEEPEEGQEREFDEREDVEEEPGEQEDGDEEEDRA